MLTDHQSFARLTESIPVHFSYPLSSHLIPAELSLGTGRTLKIKLNDSVFHYAGDELKFIPALGKTDRRIRFNDGAQCVISYDHQAYLSELEKQFSGNRIAAIIHNLEKHMRWVAVATLALVLVIFGSYRYGLPAVAKHLALQSNPALRQGVTEQSMKFIDDYFMRPTRLEADDQQILLDLFAKMADRFEPSLNLHLELRSSLIGPNAFALPDGSIIFTDELYALLQSQEQMLAVFAHEAGHVEQQHGLRLVIQNAGVALAVTLLIGDVSSWGGLATALPSLLAQSAYSREFETEADLIAAEFLIAEGLNADPMREALILLHKEVGSEENSNDLFSTHPSLKKRVEALDAYEAGL